MARQDIEFEVEKGVYARGWLFLPDGSHGSDALAAVVLGEGLAGVKEIGVQQMGETFAAAGIAAVGFDYPNFGDSDGSPRQLVDPEQQVRTYRAAVNYAANRREVDARRIGAWGASFAGAHVLRLASTGTPIASAVAVVPHVGTPRELILRQMLRPGTWVSMLRPTIPVVSASTKSPAMMQNPAAYEFLVDNVARRVPNWQNRISTRSVPKIAQYQPLSPGAALRVPTRVVLTENDPITPPSWARAKIPATAAVEFVDLPGGHFDIYGSSYEAMSSASVAWFADHLQVRA